MKAEPGHSDILILRRTQGECSFQFDFRLIPRKWTEAEMIEEGKKELQDYAGMCYSTKWLDSGVVIYFKSQSEEANCVTVSFAKLENFRIKGLTDDAHETTFIVDPGCMNVCFLEPLVPGDESSYEIGFSAIQCDSKQGPDQLTLSWVQ